MPYTAMKSASLVRALAKLDVGSEGGQVLVAGLLAWSSAMVMSFGAIGGFPRACRWT